MHTTHHPLPTEARVGPWLVSYTGRRLYPWDCRPIDIDPLDIAHGLANTCRFHGQCRVFYSVAQHSVAVADHLPEDDPLLRLWGLLHDAAEAILGDMARPLKPYCGFRTPGRHDYPAAHHTPWNVLEGHIAANIFRRFGLIGAPPPAVFVADNTALATEARDLLAPTQATLPNLPAPWPETIDPLPPPAAEELFLNRLCELTPPEDLRPWTP